jgi:hypothetical protein
MRWGILLHYWGIFVKWGQKCEKTASEVFYQHYIDNAAGLWLSSDYAQV